METRAFASVPSAVCRGDGGGGGGMESSRGPHLPPHTWSVGTTPPCPPGSLDSSEYSLGPPGDKSLSPSLDPDN